MEGVRWQVSREVADWRKRGGRLRFSREVANWRREIADPWRGGRLKERGGRLRVTREVAD